MSIQVQLDAISKLGMDLQELASRIPANRGQFCAAALLIVAELSQHIAEVASPNGVTPAQAPGEDGLTDAQRRRSSPCRDCQAPVIWAVTRNKKKVKVEAHAVPDHLIPANRETDVLYDHARWKDHVHWQSCPGKQGEEDPHA